MSMFGNGASHQVHLYSPLLGDVPSQPLPRGAALGAGPPSSSDTTALIVLNAPMAVPPSPLFYRLWQQSQIHICADGGANRLHAADPTLVPDVICGDLDSLTEAVRDFYAATGQTAIEKDADQDRNDLDKALDRCLARAADRVVVYGAFGGRFDQEMASLQALHKWDQSFQQGLWLYSDHTCACLVGGTGKSCVDPQYVIHLATPGRRKGSADARVPCEGPTCGLIPLGGACHSITTEGLQWDLCEQSSEFGGLVSTSNHLLGDTVTIESSDPLVFTAEVHSGSSSSLW